MINIVNGLNVLAQCGSIDIPDGILRLLHMAIVVIQIFVPILLIIWGMMDFAKAVIAQDEAKTKEAQKVFIRRLISAAVVFLMVTIVLFLVNTIGSINAEGSDTSDAAACVRVITGWK